MFRLNFRSKKSVHFIKKAYLFIAIIASFLFTPAATFAAEIDNISSVAFNSLSTVLNSDSNHLSFTVKATQVGNLEAVIDAKAGVKKLFEYFFIGLVVENDKFWVNLNSREPDRIMDPVLGNTDLGRLILTADLRLKQDFCRFTNPETSPVGKEYWNRLQLKARQLNTDSNKIPVMTRLWIVPDEVNVSSGQNEIYINKSRLKVCLESAYLSQKVNISDPKQKELQDYAALLMEELILPILDKEVNNGYAYADLRQIYQALILARWYKQNSGFSGSAYSRNASMEILLDTKLEYGYSPAQIYKDYLASLKNGEYNYNEANTSTNNFFSVRSVTRYVSGGVDFTNIKVTNSGRTSDIQSSGNNVVYFTCELDIPAGNNRPLQYAKNRFSLIRDRAAPVKKENNHALVALLNDLPAVTPVKTAQPKHQTYEIAVGSNKIFVRML